MVKSGNGLSTKSSNRPSIVMTSSRLTSPPAVIREIFVGTLILNGTDAVDGR